MLLGSETDVRRMSARARMVLRWAADQRPVVAWAILLEVFSRSVQMFELYKKKNAYRVKTKGQSA